MSAKDTRFVSSQGDFFYKSSDGRWFDFGRRPLPGMSDQAMVKMFGRLTIDGEGNGNAHNSPIGPGRSSPRAESPVAPGAQSSAGRDGETRCDRSDLCELSDDLERQVQGIVIWWNGLSAEVRNLVERASRRSSKSEFYPNWDSVDVLLERCRLARVAAQAPGKAGGA